MSDDDESEPEGTGPYNPNPPEIDETPPAEIEGVMDGWGSDVSKEQRRKLEEEVHERVEETLGDGMVIVDEEVLDGLVEEARWMDQYVGGDRNYGFRVGIEHAVDTIKDEAENR